ncbi:MAG: type I-E CRISPR-associated protein Cse1/CasA, partial [Armatimonadetes bacterium]|nr:type I-E CRISPR-associated protein Cse1/CasA [Armatimonadota bacterium]
MSISFNLIDQKWIPVLYEDGTVDRVGIVRALEDAGRIREIAASNPMDRIAILRFLLALLYWCKGNPDSQHVGSLPAEWFSKLNDNRDCFNLLGNGKRFYQDCGGGDKLSANYLIQEIPTGSNFSHFRHSTGAEDGICLACCATGLLRLPMFATSGGRGKPPGVNAKPPIYLIAIGASLAETLLLSWRRTDVLGKPFWEQPLYQLPLEIPLLTGLTWVPRRVWLDEQSEPMAACNSCGRLDQLVRQIVFAPIGSQKTLPDEPSRIWCDPHIVHGEKGISLHATDALGNSDAAAGQWSRIVSGILRERRFNHKIWVVGFATVQNDKYLEAKACTIPSMCLSDE